MLKSEMQHQFWITKKTVQRKLGSKEDDHIISSDAELDAKIEVYKSISETSAELSKIIDQYQERLCILSQEECVFGRFLKEVGKRSKTTGASITNTGKAVSFSGQQRMCVRVPLLRLQHEVEVFRSRAVQDTQATIQSMEKERTEYRAALSWMKSASSELDPDTGKGLEKFRTAQSHVRAAKHNFDALSMDCIQKIDLLSAARCNMYSHALVSYMNELKQFAQKTAKTFEAISNSLLLKPKYDFCVLKDLTQNEGVPAEADKIAELEVTDKDQALFFADEYVDDKDDNDTNQSTIESKSTITNVAPAQNSDNEMENILIELTQQVDDILTPMDTSSTSTSTLMSMPTSTPLTGLSESALYNAQETSNKFWSKIFNNNQNKDQVMSTTGKAQDANAANNKSDSNRNTKSNTSKTNQWLDLFAELDPLANPEAFDLKLNGGRTNFQQT